jgi:class 3 adenylate cyclase
MSSIEAQSSQVTIEKQHSKLMQELAQANMPERLRTGEGTEILESCPLEEQASIIEVDLQGFTEFCQEQPPERVMQVLNEVFGLIITTCHTDGASMKPDEKPEVIAFIGDAIRLKVTGEQHVEAGRDLARRFCENVLRKIASMHVSLGLHVAIAHGINRCYIVGNEGRKLVVNSSPAHFVVEKLKGVEDIAETFLEEQEIHDVLSPINAHPLEFLPTDDFVLNNLNIASLDELPPKGSRVLEGRIVKNMPILMLNLRNFSDVEESYADNPLQFRDIFNSLVCTLQEALEEYGGRIVNISSGRILITFGTSVGDEFLYTLVDNTITAGFSLREALRRFNSLQEEPFEWCIGINTTNAYYGLNGNAERLSPNLVSEGVNIAARWSYKGGNGDIICPREVIEDLVGLSIHTRARIKQALKGYDDEQEGVNLSQITDLIPQGILPIKAIPLKEWKDSGLIEHICHTDAPVMILSGPSGSGKTSALMYCEECDHTRTYRHVSMSHFHMKMSYGAVIQLIKCLLDEDNNGLIEETEIDSIFSPGSPEADQIRFLLGLPSRCDAISHQEVMNIIRSVMALGDGVFTIVFQNPHYIDEQNLQMLIDAAKEEGSRLRCLFEYSPETLDGKSRDLYERLRISPHAKTVEMPVEVGSEAFKESFLKIAFFELTNEPEATGEQFSNEVIQLLEKLYTQLRNLRSLSKACAILKKHILKDGSLYRFQKAPNPAAILAEVTRGTSIHDIERSCEPSDFRGLQTLALIGPQIRFVTAESILGAERLSSILQKKRLCYTCELTFTDLGEIVFNNEVLRQNLISGVETQQAQVIHREIAEFLRQESGDHVTSSVVYHHWRNFSLARKSFKEMDPSERQAMTVDLYRYGRSVFRQTGSTFFEASSMLNRAFCCNYTPDNGTWKSLVGLKKEEERELCFMLGMCLMRRGDEPFVDDEIRQLGFESPTISEVFETGAQVDNVEASPREVYWTLKNTCGLFELAHREKLRYESQGEAIPTEKLETWKQALKDALEVMQRYVPILAPLGTDFLILCSEIRRFKIILETIEENHENAIRIQREVLKSLEAAEVAEKKPMKNEALQLEKAKNLLFLSYLFAEHDPPDFRTSIEISHQALDILGLLADDTSLHGYLTRAEALNNLACTYADNHQYNEALDTLLTAINLAHSRGLFYFSKEALRESSLDVLETIRDGILKDRLVPKDFDFDRFNQAIATARSYGADDETLQSIQTVVGQ